MKKTLQEYVQGIQDDKKTLETVLGGLANNPDFEEFSAKSLEKKGEPKEKAEAMSKAYDYFASRGLPKIPERLFELYPTFHKMTAEAQQLAMKDNRLR